MPTVYLGVGSNIERERYIVAGLDADLVALDETGRPRHVMANGRWMVQDGAALIKGTFEE